MKDSFAWMLPSRRSSWLPVGRHVDSKKIEIDRTSAEVILYVFMGVYIVQCI